MYLIDKTIEFQISYNKIAPNSQIIFGFLVYQIIIKMNCFIESINYLLIFNNRNLFFVSLIISLDYYVKGNTNFFIKILVIKIINEEDKESLAIFI